MRKTTPLALVICPTAFLFFVTAVFAQAVPQYQVSPQRLDELAPTAEIIHALGMDENGQKTVKGVVIDLNGDGFTDYLVMPDARLCGTGGCPFDIFDGKNGEQIGSLFGSPVFVFSQRINGFPVLHVYSHSSAEEGAYSCYVFDGRSYAVVSSVYLEGKTVEELFMKYEEVPVYGEGN